MASCKDCIHNEVCIYRSPEKYKTVQDLKNDCAHCIPTAEVVPKSEYDELRHKYELAIAERDANVKGFAEELAKVKGEMVGKIFADIDKIIDKHHSECYEYEDGDECDTAITYISYISCDIDDLYQKYMEGADDEKQKMSY